MKIIMLLLIVFLVLVVAGGVGLLYKAMLYFQPGPGRIKKDVQAMMNEIKEWSENLVPITKNELELLSHNQINNSITKRMITSARGVLTSIYDEPMIAYAYRRYLGDKENSVLYARTANQELIYRTKNGGTKITFNNQALGEIKSDGVLYSAGTHKPMARIEKGGGELNPIIIGGREVANYKANDNSVSINSRALEFIADMKAAEEIVLLSLVIRELIREDLPS